MENIDVTYCICLKQRRAHMDLFFKKVKVKNLIFIDPFLGSNLSKYSEEELISKNYITHNHILKKNNVNYHNKIANAITFNKIFELFLGTNFKNCLIFEDDLKIPNQEELYLINYRMNTLFKIINPNWQYINLGRCWDRSCKRHKIYSKSYFEVGKCLPVCTHSIIVKRKIAKYLLEQTLPLYEPKDNTWRNIIHNHDYWKEYAYCSQPSIFQQDRNTIISTLIPNNINPNECVGRKNINYVFNYDEYFNKIIILLLLIILFKCFQIFY